MKLDYINAMGGVLPLVNNKDFFLVDLEGQTAANADISSVVIGGIDGDIPNNVQTQPRTIVLTLRINPSVNVEEAKRQILNVVKLKQNGYLLWEQNERTVRIEGVVESVEMPRWNNAVAMQITLHCSQPFWEDIENVVQEISEIINLHYFTNIQGDMLYFPESGIPFGQYDFLRTKTYTNLGDVDVGIEIEIKAYDTVTNPVITDTFGHFFGVGHGNDNKKVTMQAGDIIRINTNKGQKSVVLNGTTNLLDKVLPQSTWLQLRAGGNQFSIDSDDQSHTNMAFNLFFKQRYI